jgi:hypothetical protein
MKEAIIISSHRRSGTHLTIDLIQKHFSESRSVKKIGEPMDRLYLNFDALGNKKHKRCIDYNTAQKILNSCIIPKIKTHKTYSEFSNIESDILVNLGVDRIKSIYVVRDVRNVICSLYAYEKGFKTIRLNLDQYFTEDDGARLLYWAKHVKSWMNSSNSLIIRFEDVLKNPLSVLDNIRDFIGFKKENYVNPLLPKPWINNLECYIIGHISKQPRATTIRGKRKGISLPEISSLRTETKKIIDCKVGNLLSELGYSEF